jgi:hypothetical protein
MFLNFRPACQREKFRKPLQNFCSGSPSLSLVDFLQRTRHSQLSEQFSELQAALVTTFLVKGGYLKAGTD